MRYLELEDFFFENYVENINIYPRRINFIIELENEKFIQIDFINVENIEIVCKSKSKYLDGEVLQVDITKSNDNLGFFNVGFGLGSIDNFTVIKFNFESFEIAKK